MTYQQINESIEACYQRLSELKRMKAEADDNPFASRYLKLIDDNSISIFCVKEVHRGAFDEVTGITGVQMYVTGIAEFQNKAYLHVNQLAGKEIQPITREEFTELFNKGLENIQSIAY